MRTPDHQRVPSPRALGPTDRQCWPTLTSTSADSYIRIARRRSSRVATFAAQVSDAPVFDRIGRIGRCWQTNNHRRKKRRYATHAGKLVLSMFTAGWPACSKPRGSDRESSEVARDNATQHMSNNPGHQARVFIHRQNTGMPMLAIYKRPIPERPLVRGREALKLSQLSWSLVNIFKIL